MPAPGTTGELYSDPNNPSSTLTSPPPPSAPAPIPPPTQPVAVQAPVVVKARMADEKPDGSIRDTSADALRPGNDLNFRKVDADPKVEVPAPTPPTQESKPPSQTPQTAETPASPPTEKVYAGKFKSPEELEKAYVESQSAMTRAMQEAADAKRAATPPPAPKIESPEVVASRAKANEDFLNKFVADPTKVVEEIQQRSVQQVTVALAAQEATNNWRKANPDIAAHEFYVAAEAYRLSQADPDLGAKPADLLQKATENFRQVFGAIRAEGAKEALTTESRVIPLLSPTTPAPLTEQPSKAPLSASDSFDAHIAMLKAEERRSHSGLRR